MTVVQPGSVFIRQGTRLPDGLKAQVFEDCDWLHIGNAPTVEEKLHSAGWRYLELLGKEQSVTMFGMRPIEALRKATLQALNRVPQHRNAAEVLDVKMTNVGGVFFATLCMVPRQIQESSVFEFAEPGLSAGSRMQTAHVATA